ncbi:MAG: HAMP domain-containing sensor histidine kinase [Clostridia bacterium]
MVKVNLPLRNQSLRKSIIGYITVFALVGVLLSALTASFCNIVATRIKASYPASTETYYLTSEDGTQMGTVPTNLSTKDERLVAALGFIPIVATPLYSALCILMAALLFYKNKLKKPLGLLMAASDKISHNDLDFSVAYESGDELGGLCASFETMRQALSKNFSDMWRQMEERKQLNTAFAHDLRTPLTVLKGYNEMLESNDNRQARDTAHTMKKHIARMERYVDSMSRLQRLEDTAPEYQTIPLQDFLTSLSAEAKLVCSKSHKEIVFENRTTASQANIDPEIVSQVFGNLLSNATRYAVSRVHVIFGTNDNGLFLSVADDGRGFSSKALQRAAMPYFSEETNHTEHFGLGLYICKILCEHHGGGLILSNSDTGGIVTAAFKDEAM